jgi:hypothetical protein
MAVTPMGVTVFLWQKGISHSARDRRIVHKQLLDKGGSKA